MLILTSVAAIIAIASVALIYYESERNLQALSAERLERYSKMRIRCEKYNPIGINIPFSEIPKEKICIELNIYVTK